MRGDGRLVLVRYYDHLLFRNVRKGELSPVVRETVGWLEEENDLYIKLIWDRSVIELPNERKQDRISGMIILKPLILEVIEVKLVSS